MAPWGSIRAGLNARDMDGGFPWLVVGGLNPRDEPSDQAAQAVTNNNPE